MGNAILLEDMREKMGGGNTGATWTRRKTVKTLKMVGHFMHAVEVLKSRIEYGRIYVENIHMEEFLMLWPSTYSSGNIRVPPFITLHVCAILGSYSGAVWRDQLSCSECGISRVVVRNI